MSFCAAGSFIDFTRVAASESLRWRTSPTACFSTPNGPGSSLRAGAGAASGAAAAGGVDACRDAFARSACRFLARSARDCLELALERDAAVDRLATDFAEGWFADLLAADFVVAGLVVADFVAADFVTADFVAADLVAADFVAVDLAGADLVAVDLVAASAGIIASMEPTTNHTATPTRRGIPFDPGTASPLIWRLPARAAARGLVPRSETRLNTDSPRLPCCFVHLYHGIRKETVTLGQHRPKSGLGLTAIKVPFSRPRARLA